MRPNWTIEKDTVSGSSFRLLVGTRGLPGSHEVGGLSSDQCKALGSALQRLEELAEWQALENVRDALKINHR